MLTNDYISEWTMGVIQ